MARILIFGGSFSPPTLAHEEIIRQCLALPDFSAVWVMPSGDRADKRIGVSVALRLEMLKIVQNAAFPNETRLLISDFELQLPTPSETARTAKALTAAYPEDEFWFVFGTDSYQDMPNWPDGARLQATLNMVVFGRGGAQPALRPGVIFLPLTGYHHISSSQTREAAKLAKGTAGLVSAAIQDYIGAHKLYA